MWAREDFATSAQSLALDFLLDVFVQGGTLRKENA